MGDFHTTSMCRFMVATQAALQPLATAPAATRHRRMQIEVQVKDKFCLTIDEASEYFNIGEKKMRKLVAENMDSGFVIQNGVKVLIKRKRFEAFLDDLSAI